jgi:hypothetical protein
MVQNLAVVSADSTSMTLVELSERLLTSTQAEGLQPSVPYLTPAAKEAVK